MSFNFTIVIDEDFDEEQFEKLMEADRLAIDASAENKKGIIIGQVFINPESMRVKGSFIEHEYAKRIQDILEERAAAIRSRKTTVTGASSND